MIFLLDNFFAKFFVFVFDFMNFFVFAVPFFLLCSFIIKVIRMKEEGVPTVDSLLVIISIIRFPYFDRLNRLSVI